MRTARIWAFTEDEKMTRRINFSLPQFGEPGFYRSIVSFEAHRQEFFRRLHKTPTKERYTLSITDDVTEAMLNRKRFPVEKVESIWAAYVAIGYDYKSRTFKVVS